MPWNDASGLTYVALQVMGLGIGADYPLSSVITAEYVLSMQHSVQGLTMVDLPLPNTEPV